MRPNAVTRAKARASSGSYLRKTATTREVHTQRANKKERCLQLRYLDIWRIGNSQGMTTVKQQEAFVMAAASVHRLGISARSVMYEMKIFLHSSSDDSTPHPA